MDTQILDDLQFLGKYLNRMHQIGETDIEMGNLVTYYLKDYRPFEDITEEEVEEYIMALLDGDV